MKDQPPKLVERLFALFYSDAFLEDLLGDLDELYAIKRSKSTRLQASAFYWYQAFRLLASYAIVKRKRDRSVSNYYPSQNSTSCYSITSKFLSGIS